MGGSPDTEAVAAVMPTQGPGLTTETAVAVLLATGRTGAGVVARWPDCMIPAACGALVGRAGGMACRRIGSWVRRDATAGRAVFRASAAKATSMDAALKTRARIKECVLMFPGRLSGPALLGKGRNSTAAHDA